MLGSGSGSGGEGSEIDSMTVWIIGIVPAMSVTSSSCVAPSDTTSPYSPISGLIASLTLSAGRRPIGIFTVTSSCSPRLSRSSRSTCGTTPSGIPSSMLITISIRPDRTSV